MRAGLEQQQEGFLVLLEVGVVTQMEQRAGHEPDGPYVQSGFPSLGYNPYTAPAFGFVDQSGQRR